MVEPSRSLGSCSRNHLDGGGAAPGFRARSCDRTSVGAVHPKWARVDGRSSTRCAHRCRGQRGVDGCILRSAACRSPVLVAMGLGGVHGSHDLHDFRVAHRGPFSQIICLFILLVIQMNRQSFETVINYI